MASLAPWRFNFSSLRWSLPNKFFDYVQARLALLIGPSQEMRDVLTRHQLGASAEGFDIDDIVRCIESIDAERVSAWKANADAAARPLSAEAQVKTWSDAVAALFGRDPGQR